MTLQRAKNAVHSTERSISGEEAAVGVLGALRPPATSSGVGGGGYSSKQLDRATEDTLSQAILLIKILVKSITMITAPVLTAVV